MNDTGFITLADGRRLAYAELGVEAGAAVFYMHGLPGSRVDLVAADPLLAALGVRLF